MAAFRNRMFDQTYSNQMESPSPYSESVRSGRRPRGPVMSLEDTQVPFETDPSSAFESPMVRGSPVSFTQPMAGEAPSMMGIGRMPSSGPMGLPGFNQSGGMARTADFQQNPDQVAEGYTGDARDYNDWVRAGRPPPSQNKRSGPPPSLTGMMQGFNQPEGMARTMDFQQNPDQVSEGYTGDARDYNDWVRAGRPPPQNKWGAGSPRPGEPGNAYKPPSGPPPSLMGLQGFGPPPSLTDTSLTDIMQGRPAQRSQPFQGNPQNRPRAQFQQMMKNPRFMQALMRMMGQFR